MKFLYCILPVVVFSCQTIDRTQKAEFTKEQKKSFAACRGGEGYRSLKVAVSDEPQFAGEYEWLATRKGSFDVNVLSPLGDNILLLRGRNQGKHLLLSNRYAEKLPLTVGSDGFLRFSDHWVGLKAAELPCFLRGKLPLAWSNNPYSYVLNPEKTKFFLEEEHRDIYLDFHEDRVCFDIRWNVFWVFRQADIKVCYYKGEKKKTTFVLDGKYSLVTEGIH